MLSPNTHNSSNRHNPYTGAQSRRTYLRCLNLRRLKVRYDSTHLDVVLQSAPEDRGDDESR